MVLFAPRRIAATAGLLAAVGLVSIAAGAVNQPTTGTYQGNAKGAAVFNGHSEGEGWFKLKKNDAGKYVIVGAKQTGGDIVSPSDPRDISPKACNQYNARIPADRIRVRDGRFRWEGDSRIGYSSTPGATPPKVHVIFKGRWETKTEVVGKTRFQRGSCDDTRQWTMKTPPAPY